EARIWEDGEKNYLQSATQILAMSMANDEMAMMLKEVQEENNLVAEVATAIASYKNIQDALNNCANLLLGRLGVERFLLLQTDGNYQGQNIKQVDKSLLSSMTNYQGGLSNQTKINYNVVFQQQNRNTRGAIASLPLGENDHKVLFTPGKIIAIEDWEIDKRLPHWREILMPLGVKSLLVCSCTSGGLLVLANSNNKTWQHTDYTLMPIISQQIGQLLHLLGRENDITNTSKGNQILMKGLNALLFASLDPTLFERNFIDFLARTLEFPLTLLITSSSRRSKAKLAVGITNDSRFELPKDFDISMETDPLLQKVITANDIVCYSVAEGHRTWVSLMGAKKVYMIPVTWQGQPMKGIILLGDTIQKEIPNDLLPFIKILVEQFAQLRQYRRWNLAVQKQVSDLEQLNWYKHSYLSSLHQDFKGLALNFTQAYSTIKMPSNAQALLSDITETITELEALINQEEWELKLNLSSVPLVNILNKTLRSIDAITT
ncbi:MAG TPA: hypothetical protein V6C58_05410, partial [Allocoleopsis sp.]